MILIEQMIKNSVIIRLINLRANDFFIFYLLTFENEASKMNISIK